MSYVNFAEKFRPRGRSRAAASVLRFRGIVFVAQKNKKPGIYVVRLNESAGSMAQATTLSTAGRDLINNAIPGCREPPQSSSRGAFGEKEHLSRLFLISPLVPGSLFSRGVRGGILDPVDLIDKHDASMSARIYLSQMCPGMFRPR